MSKKSQTTPGDVRQHLLDAALHCFLEEDYHDVSMRRVATMANANMSMIYYYFGNKEGLFEEVLRTWLQPLIDNIQSENTETPEDFESFFRMYYRAALIHPRFPMLIMKTLNSTHAPGARFLCETVLERGRKSGIAWTRWMQERGEIADDIDPDLLRIAVVSMSMMPMLIRDFLERQLDDPVDEAFFIKLSRFYARILSRGITPDHDTDAGRLS